MSKYINFFTLLSLFSCSYVNLQQLDGEEAERFRSRMPAALQTNACEKVLSELLEHVELGEPSDISRHIIEFTVKPQIRGKNLPLGEVFFEALGRGSQNAHIKIVKNFTKNHGVIDGFRVVSSLGLSFGVELYRKGSRPKIHYRLIFNRLNDPRSSNFYVEILQTLLSKQMINLKMGSLDGVSIFTKVRKDFIIKSLANNLKTLKRNIKYINADTLINQNLEQVSSNLDLLKKDIYKTLDNKLIGNYFDLVSEVERLKQSSLVKNSEKSKQSLTKAQKFLNAMKLFSFKEYKKKEKSLITTNRDVYSKKLSEIEDINLSFFHEDGEKFEEYFGQYIFLRKMQDKASIIHGLLPEIDYEKFYLYYQSKVSSNSKSRLLSKEKNKYTMFRYYEELVEDYRVFESKYPSWSIWTSNKQNKIFRNMEDKLSVKAAEAYNKVTKVTLSEISSNTEFKRKIMLSILNFKAFESNFNGVGFAHWLEAKGIPSLEDFQKLKVKYPDYSVGDYVMNKYFEYAPYAKFDDKLNDPFFKRQSSKIKENFGKMRSKIKNCKGKSSCIHELFIDPVHGLFQGDAWKKRFSCLWTQDLWIASLRDFALFTGTQIALYGLTNPERFPWELLSTAILFNGFHDEANCRVSRSPLRDFGRQVNPKELKASNHLKWQFRFEGAKSLMITSAYSAAGLTASSMLFNYIYMMTGHPVSEDITWKDSLKMLGFNYFHFGVWGNLKKFVFWLPLRHGLLPRIIKNMQHRFPLRTKNGDLYSRYYKTIMDSGFYFGQTFVNSWDYLVFYRKSVMPWMMKKFDIELEGFAPMNEKYYDAQVLAVEELINETRLDLESNIWINSIELSNGIKTKIFYRERYDKVAQQDRKIVIGVKQYIPDMVQEGLYSDYFKILGGNLEVENSSGTSKIMFNIPKE